jgi:hypothetical protein
MVFSRDFNTNFMTSLKRSTPFNFETEVDGPTK